MATASIFPTNIPLPPRVIFRASPTSCVSFVTIPGTKIVHGVECASYMIRQISKWNPSLSRFLYFFVSKV